MALTLFSSSVDARAPTSQQVEISEAVLSEINSKICFLVIVEFTRFAYLQ